MIGADATAVYSETTPEILRSDRPSIDVFHLKLESRSYLRILLSLRVDTSRCRGLFSSYLARILQSRNNVEVDTSIVGGVADGCSSILSPAEQVAAEQFVRVSLRKAAELLVSELVQRRIRDLLTKVISSRNMVIEAWMEASNVGTMSAVSEKAWRHEHLAALTAAAMATRSAPAASSHPSAALERSQARIGYAPADRNRGTCLYQL